MQTACHRWQTILIVINIEQWLLKYESTPYKTMLNLECGVLGGALIVPTCCGGTRELRGQQEAVQRGRLHPYGMGKLSWVNEMTQ
jgi:hypothetical protein